MNKLDLKEVMMSPHQLIDWFLAYHESLDEAGRERLWVRLDMNNYEPKEMEPSVFKKRLEQQAREADPNGSYMKAIYKKMDDELEWDLITPWWKKVLVKMGVV